MVRGFVVLVLAVGGGPLLELHRCDLGSVRVCETAAVRVGIAVVVVLMGLLGAGWFVYGDNVMKLFDVTPMVVAGSPDGGWTDDGGDY